MALAELAEKGADVDVLRQMVQFMAQRLMELDVEGRCGAGYDEKTAERLNSRNGCRDRTWDTRRQRRVEVPQAAPGHLLPRVPRAPAHRREGSDRGHPGGLRAGISTRSVDNLVKALGMSGVSKSQVSRLCGELDERVGAFLGRQIEGDWPDPLRSRPSFRDRKTQQWLVSVIPCALKLVSTPSSRPASIRCIRSCSRARTPAA